VAIPLPDFAVLLHAPVRHCIIRRSIPSGHKSGSSVLLRVRFNLRLRVSDHDVPDPKSPGRVHDKQGIENHDHHSILRKRGVPNLDRLLPTISLRNARLPRVLQRNYVSQPALRLQLQIDSANLRP